MPVRNYSVLKGKPVEGAVFQPLHPERDQPHYHIHVKNDDGGQFDIAVNILSDDGSEVLFEIKSDFSPRPSSSLEALPLGITALHQGNPNALDFVKQHLISKSDMSTVLISETVDTPLSQRIDALIQSALADDQGLVYAWGSVFSNQGRSPFWHFTPDIGIHDIHMNQGNPPGHHDADNGADQDGGMSIFADGKFTTVFLAFQTQSFETDENGNVSGDAEPVANPQGSHGQHLRPRRRHHGGRHPG